MKILPALPLIVIFMLSLCVRANGEMTLTYKTAEGPIKIEGFHDKKPYSSINGVEQYLPVSGIFEIEADLDDLAKYAYFPVLFTRERDFSTPADKNDSADPAATTRIITKYSVFSERPNRRQSYEPWNAVFANCSKIWGEQLPEKMVFVFAWIDPQGLIHRINLTTGALVDMDKIHLPHRLSYSSPKKLFPAVLLMSSDGAFLKIDDAFSKFPAWNEACICLMNDDANRLSALLRQNSGMFQGSVLNTKLIHIAASYGSLDCMDFLLKSGADPDLETEFELRPIHLAARAGESEVIKLLLEKGANIKAYDEKGNTALHLAASFGHLDVCKLLVNQGIKVNLKNQDRETAILLAGKNDQSAVIMFLAKNKAVFDFAKRSRQILLLRAIKRNELDAVEFFLSRKAQADKPIHGKYPIHYAAEHAGAAIIRLLIENGADPNRKNEKGGTPLMIASTSNYGGVIALVENGAEINDATETGITALHLAILKHQIEITQYLLDHGANPNLKNPDGTPLMWLATEAGNRIGLNALIDAGAVCEMDRTTAIPIMEYAFRYNIPEIVEITLSQCLEADFKFHEVFPSYWVAERYGSQAIKDLLVQYGVDPSTVEEPSFVNPRLVRDQIRLIEKQDANFPVDLQEKYGEFVAKVEGIIDTDGSFILPKIIQNPVPEMNRKILESFTHWKFNPLEIEGRPARIRLVVPMKYVPAPQKEEVYEMGVVSIAPEPMRVVNPQYPPDFLKRKIPGQVVLIFVVDKEGRVRDPQVESASDDELIEPAIEAILRWEYEPGHYDGEPVNVRCRQLFRFNLP